MFLKVLGFIVDILLSSDETDDKPNYHVSEDDGFTDATYDDGTGNEYERAWDGEIRDFMGNTPDE
jgi:hypothetical protein